MKRLLYLIVALSASVWASARTAADSARVRLETSAGAEIGIDDDMSSTNILTKKVPLGRHTVKVTYGMDFERTFEIDVTHDETFDFGINGKLSVSSVPSGRSVFVDGIERGQTPLELDLVGEHNIRVVGDDLTYFDATERVGVNPFETMARSYTLGRRPPRGYGMAMVNYSGGGPGIFLGYCKRFGAYLRLNMSLENPDAEVTWDETDDLPRGIAYHDGDSKVSYKLMAVGLVARCHKNVYAYLGSGYGEYKKCFEGLTTFAPYGAKGALVDVGVILKWKALLLSGGYTHILGSNNPKAYHELNVGIGFTIHKNKKQQR